MVYISPEKIDFPPDNQPTAELADGDNIVYLSDIDVPIESGKK